MNSNLLTGGQFTPARSGQFGPAYTGQLKPAQGGQFHRRLHFEIDQFLKSYAELIYDCFSDLENESGKVIEMNNNQNNLKAA